MKTKAFGLMESIEVYGLHWHLARNWCGYFEVMNSDESCVVVSAALAP